MNTFSGEAIQLEAREKQIAEALRKLGAAQSRLDTVIRCMHCDEDLDHARNEIAETIWLLRGAQ